MRVRHVVVGPVLVLAACGADEEDNHQDEPSADVSEAADDVTEPEAVTLPLDGVLRLDGPGDIDCFLPDSADLQGILEIIVPHTGASCDSPQFQDVEGLQVRASVPATSAFEDDGVDWTWHPGSCANYVQWEGILAPVCFVDTRSPDGSDTGARSIPFTMRKRDAAENDRNTNNSALPFDATVELSWARDADCFEVVLGTVPGTLTVATQIAECTAGNLNRVDVEFYRDDTAISTTSHTHQGCERFEDEFFVDFSEDDPRALVCVLASADPFAATNVALSMSFATN